MPSDLIYREDAKDYARHAMAKGLNVLEYLDEVPATAFRPVVRGKWIDMGDFISCSSCNATRLKEFESDYGKAKRLDIRTNFCPNCGADMRETNDEKA